MESNIGMCFRRSTFLPIRSCSTFLRGTRKQATHREEFMGRGIILSRLWKMQIMTWHYPSDGYSVCRRPTSHMLQTVSIYLELSIVENVISLSTEEVSLSIFVPESIVYRVRQVRPIGQRSRIVCVARAEANMITAIRVVSWKYMQNSWRLEITAESLHPAATRENNSAAAKWHKW